MSIDGWVKVLLSVSGFCDGQFYVKRSKMVDAQEFMLSIRRVQPDQYPIPRICDECKSPCISECLFGESFCSRACFRKSWKTVFENASFKILLSKMEMAEILTIREKEIAQGIINDVQEAALIELRKVKISSRYRYYKHSKYLLT